ARAGTAGASRTGSGAAPRADTACGGRNEPCGALESGDSRAGWSARTGDRYIPDAARQDRWRSCARVPDHRAVADVRAAGVPSLRATCGGQRPTPGRARGTGANDRGGEGPPVGDERLAAARVGAAPGGRTSADEPLLAGGRAGVWRGAYGVP